MAGLRCSIVLARSGIKVTLLEGRDRIGGRIWQQRTGTTTTTGIGADGGYLVDMGPNWIHGTKGNPIMALAEKVNAVVIDPEEDGALFGSDGRRRPSEEANALSAEIWGLIADAFKYSEDKSAEIDPQMSLFEYIQARVNGELLDHDKNNNVEADKAGVARRKNLDRTDLLREAERWGPFVGDPVQRQSLRFFWLEECIEGENVFVASTYRDILAEVWRSAEEQQRRGYLEVRLETEVLLVEIGPNDTHDDGNGGSAGRVTVSTAAGRSRYSTTSSSPHPSGG